MTIVTIPFILDYSYELGFVSIFFGMILGFIMMVFMKSKK